MDTKERARIATAAATRARRMTKWRRWADEMRENGWGVSEPGEDPAVRLAVQAHDLAVCSGMSMATAMQALKDAAEMLTPAPEIEIVGPMEPGGLFGDGIK